MSSSTALSESVEEYLEAIHRLSGSAKGVSTTGLARQLGVRPASVTGMLRRLAELGLITYRRYRNIALTDRGEQRAHEVIRRHRLAERLLTDMLGVPLDQAHEEACRLEHAVSPELEGRMAEALGGPRACPHGHPIDAAAEDRSVGLTEAPLNRQLTIVRLDDESPEVVRYLAGLGLLPGARVVVKLREPRDGAVVVETAGVTRTLGPDLAAGVRVARVRRARTG